MEQLFYLRQLVLLKCQGTGGDLPVASVLIEGGESAFQHIQCAEALTRVLARTLHLQAWKYL